jgi:dihydropteroate synthase
VSDASQVSYRPGLPRGVSFDGGAADGPALRPTGLLYGRTAERAVAEGYAAPLAGGPIAFAAGEVLVSTAVGLDIHSADLRTLRAWAERGDAPGAAQALARLSAPRPPFAGVALDRPRLMGVVNVTPDSFSDGGRFIDPQAAIAHGEALMVAGCDIVDVGGESTRPGAQPTPEEEELRRVLPVIRALAKQGAPVSIDTRRARVMRAAVEAGARIINDVTALSDSPESLGAAAATGAPVVLMHMQGEPATMQRKPVYRLPAADILAYLRIRVAACVAAGIPRARIAVDPGIGFGKTASGNAQLIAESGLFHEIGCAVAIGLSRKSFIARLAHGEPAADRLPGTLAGVAAAVGQGVQFHRVHDVAEARQALAILAAIMAH